MQDEMITRTVEVGPLVMGEQEGLVEGFSGEVMVGFAVVS